MYRINCIGDICPVPVIKAKRALADISDFNGLEILVDNEIAVQNISKFLNALEHSFSVGKEREFFLISVSGAGEGSTNPTSIPIEEPTGSRPSSEIVVISSQFMGTGDDNLGKLLMKGFIFALTQLESLPTSVIFYNSGVYHALKNSECLNDLHYLHNQGVKILVCGTCLNHFNVLDSLAVGEVTNMYEIVNLMQQASGIIRP
jgi:selenium metabolism protein YedF